MNDTLDSELRRIAAAMTDEAPDAPHGIPSMGLRSVSAPLSTWRGVSVAVGTALVVVLALGGLILLNPSTTTPLSEDPSASTPTVPLTSATLGAGSVEAPPPPLTNEAVLGDALLHIDQGQTAPKLVDLGGALAVAGAEIAYISLDSGITWTETAPLPDSDVITKLAGWDRTLVAIGTNDVPSSSLYVSHDRGEAWTSVDLPVPEGVVGWVPQELAVRDGEVLLAGAGTTTSFDDDTRVYVWRSNVGGGSAWTVEEVAQMGSDFTIAEAIVWIGLEPVVLAQTFSNRILAFESQSGSWRIVDVGSVVANQAAIGPEMGDITLAGADVIGDEAFVWWRFEDGAGDTAAVLARRSEEFGWEAKRDIGPDGEQPTISDHVLRVDGAYIAIGHLETPRGVPATSSSILVSYSGLGWLEIARIGGVDLTNLVAIDTLEFLAVGNETQELEGGGTAWTALGAWTLEITNPVTDLLDQAFAETTDD